MQAVQNLMREHAENLLESSDGVQREFFVSFINTPQLFRLRQLKALDLGKLVSFAGKPEYPISACLQLRKQSDVNIFV